MQSCGLLIIEPELTGGWGIYSQWDSIDEAFFEEKLPEDVHEMYQLVRNTGNDLSGVWVTTNLNHARRFAEWMARGNHPYALISVYSGQLARRKKIFEVPRSKQLGYDYVITGCGSMIQQACDTPIMEHWKRKLNHYGLFPTDKDLLKFEVEYVEHVLHSRLEELPGPNANSPFDAIEICDVTSILGE